MPSTLRQIQDDPHDAPIAPDIVPAEWADCVPSKPANDALSREKLFAEIRHAAETAAPAVDATFRASDVNDIPTKKKASSREWMKRAAIVFVFALVSAVATAAWKHHGDAATETLATWVPLPGVNSSPATEAPTAEANADANAQPAADRQAVAAPPATQAASTTALPPEAEQQIQSMARDLAAMGQQVEQLKATIEALKANQQAGVAPAPPVARAPAPPPKPKVTALPRPPAPPPAYPPRAAYPPAVQAAAVPPPPAPGVAPPPAYQPPPQATTQPNGEPIVRPPMPMPLSDRY